MESDHRPATAQSAARCNGRDDDGRAVKKVEATIAHDKGGVVGRKGKVLATFARRRRRHTSDDCASPRHLRLHGAVLAKSQPYVAQVMEPTAIQGELSTAGDRSPQR